MAQYTFSFEIIAKSVALRLEQQAFFFCICFTIQSFPCLHPQPPNYLKYFALHSTLPSPCFVLCPLDSYQVQEYVVSCQYNNCSFVVYAVSSIFFFLVQDLIWHQAVDCLCSVMGTCPQPFFVFHDMDILEGYSPVSGIRLAFRLVP